MNNVGECLLLLAILSVRTLNDLIIGVRSALHRVLRSRGFDAVKLDPWYFPSIQTYTKVSGMTDLKHISAVLNCQASSSSNPLRSKSSTYPSHPA